MIHSIIFVQSLSHVQLFATPWTVAHKAPLSSTVSQNLLKFMSFGLVMLFNHFILWFCLQSLLFLPSIFPSFRVFSNESVLRIRWPKYKSFSFNISPSNEYSGLFFFRIDWFYLLAIQGTVKSLLQYHSSKAVILSAQLSLWSNSHIHTWKLSFPYWKNCNLDYTDLCW